jgi:hypothetical protein
MFGFDLFLNLYLKLVLVFNLWGNMCIDVDCE